MIGRILRIVFLVSLAVLIANRLFSRRQKRALDEVIRISAWVVFIISSLAFLLHVWLGLN